MLGNVEGAVSPTVDALCGQGRIAEDVHYFLWEIGSPFDKPGCFPYKSSCVCLAGKQGLWDVSSLM